MRSSPSWFTSFDKLKSENPEVAWQGINQVARFGRFAQSRLRQLLETNEPIAMGNALRALGKIQTKSAMYTVIQYLTDEREEIGLAAREAITNFGDNPEAAEKMHAYDAWQKSRKAFDACQESDPATNVLYIDRFIAVSDRTLLTLALFVATSAIQPLFVDRTGVVSGVTVQVSTATGEDRRFLSHWQQDNLRDNPLKVRSSAPFRLSFTSPEEMDLALARLPTFIFSDSETEVQSLECTGKILLPNWADYPDLIACQVQDNGAMYYKMAVLSLKNGLLSRDPEQSTEGALRDEARREPIIPGDVLVFNGIQDALGEAYGVIIVGDPTRDGCHKLTIRMPANGRGVISEGSILYRKLFWREVPREVGKPEPYNVIRNTPIVDLTRISA